VTLKDVHVSFGYVMAVNLLWRFAWAFFGNRYARWRAVVPGGPGYLTELRVEIVCSAIAEQASNAWADFFLPARAFSAFDFLRFRSTGSPTAQASAAAPAIIIIEIAEFIEAALQFVRAAALLLGDLPAWHVSAPLEVGLGVGNPSRAPQTTPKSTGCLGLNNSDACIDFARGALAFDISAAIIAAELE
jgi:hypothetical protein